LACYVLSLQGQTHFFSPRVGQHRARHSFPTRRSSDLGQADEAIRMPFPQLPGAHALHAARTGGALEVIHLVVPLVAGEVHLEEQDRKSTRLNSSHVKVSYAVFCLKKKTLCEVIDTIDE